MRLPIDEIEGEVRAAVSAPKPLIVTAPTGSGKSTRLPLWLADDGAQVLVIEPRRVACRALATFLAGQRGESVGESIGYSVRFDDRRGPKTHVHFVTPGVALNILGSSDPFRYDHVIVDEFHERGWQVDLAVMLLRRRFEDRLVFTSATLDAAELAQRMDATVLEAGGRTFPVDISYRGEVGQPTPNGLTQRVAGAVKTALSSTDGDVLVFLPGKREIGECEQALRSESGVEIVPVHGSLPADQMTRALGDRPAGAPRRIFLATNVAETSLTLPGVRAVIDSGLVRMQIHRGGRTALALVPISRASMDQRSGRAGRVSAGVCYRLWESRWAPAATTRPEIERVELDDAVLAATRAGVPLSELADCPWVTPPPEFSLERACRHLRDAGVIDDAQNITDYGVRLGELPVSVFEARILHDPPDELRATVADVVALMQARGALLLPTSAAVAEHRRELFDASTSEVDEALIALRHGDPGRHKLNGSSLREARLAAKRFRGLLGCKRLDPHGDHDAPRASGELAKHILRRVPEAAYLLRDRAKGRRAFGRGEPWSNGEVELRLYPWEPHDPERRTVKDLPVAGAVLEQFWIGDDTGYGVNGVGRMLLPCRPQVLAELGLGDLEVAQVRVTRGQVTATVRRELAGVVLEEGEKVLRGAELCDAAAGLILEGRLMKKTDARERIAEGFHLWRILASWRPTDDTAHWDLTAVEKPIEDEATWLAARLREVGVERTEDLSLLEGEDVAPDVADLSGIAAWELQTLRDDFPRTWDHRGGTYRCDVRPTTSTVLLIPIDGAARREGAPARQQLPRFRGFKVIYKNASREVVVRG